MLIVYILQIIQRLEYILVFPQRLRQQFFQRNEHPSKILDRFAIQIQFHIVSIVVLEIHQFVPQQIRVLISERIALIKKLQVSWR